MSWTPFLSSTPADIIETKKLRKFEISTPFRPRAAAIRNIGGVSAKSESRNERPPKRGHISKTKPPKTMKITTLSCFLLQIPNMTLQTHRTFQRKAVGVPKWDKLHPDHTLGVTTRKAQILLLSKT